MNTNDFKDFCKNLYIDYLQDKIELSFDMFYKNVINLILNIPDAYNNYIIVESKINNPDASTNYIIVESKMNNPTINTTNLCNKERTKQSELDSLPLTCSVAKQLTTKSQL